MDVSSVRILRFGEFELHVRSGELLKRGVRMRLQEQSFQILLMLLQHPGEVVLREDIRQKLWPNNTIVEFDHSINAAIKRLRQALGETAEDPRYIETLAKRGYRFSGDVREDPTGKPVVADQAQPAAKTAGEDLSGTTLSHYRVLEKLGSGAVGVVYRAEDLKLSRQVALKVLHSPASELPAAVLQRFEREGRAASSLNHPHICTVYSVDHFEGEPVIVMELVEGETLAARLAKGAMGLEQALAFAIQVAGALAESHRHGVVHRDLKPANIMLTKSGAKVLDFGVAKTERVSPATAGPETLTKEGIIVGTLPYMSPEQVLGKPADVRSDIFSFGLVLYEMLTGHRAFEGESAASVTAGILEREPPPTGNNVPPDLNRLLERCLTKDPEERWQSAQDLKTALEWVAEGAPQRWPERRAVGSRIAGLAAMLVAAIVLILSLATKPHEQRVVRLELPAAGNDHLGEGDSAAISPDGTRIVFTADGGQRLLVRYLDSQATQEVPGSEGGHYPFWSPDGTAVAYFSGGKLKKASMLGGSPIALSNADSSYIGGTWNRDGVILFAPSTRSPLFRISANGGTPVRVTQLDAARGETSHSWPSFLPDGKHFLFAVHASEPTGDGVFIGSLDSPKVTRLLPEEGNAQYTEPGYILFSRGGTLMAQPFDSGRLRFTGEASPLADEVSGDRPYPARFSASAGILVYRAGGPGGPSRLRWFDRKGNWLGDVGPAGRYREPALSTDGRAVAVAVKAVSRWDIWVFDPVRGTSSRLTSGQRNHDFPVWSPDGRQIAFSFDRDPLWVIHRVLANGASEEEPVVELDRSAVVSQWTRDGKFQIMTLVSFGASPREIWAAPVSRGEKPFPIVTGPFDNTAGSVSPDGKWIAYVGIETGKRAVYVQEFPPKGGKWRISTNEGYAPKWRSDGRELFYRSGTKMISVEMKASAGKFEAGIPVALFDVPLSADEIPFDVSADGQRFLLVVPNEGPGTQSLSVVLNWPMLMKKHLDATAP